MQVLHLHRQRRIQENSDCNASNRSFSDRYRLQGNARRLHELSYVVRQDDQCIADTARCSSDRASRVS